MATPAKWTFVYAGIGALITWLALIIQYVIMVQNRSNSLGAVTVNFLSYFTILSNILAAFCFTLYFLRGKDPSTGPKYASLFSAVCVYILVVGLIYNLVLRKVSPPAGANILPNELLHVVVPLVYLIFWIFILPSGHLALAHSWKWLLFPACYFLYTIVRGKILDVYPYPFTNITELGLGKVLLNCLGVAVLFWLLSALLIWLKLKLGGQ